MLLRVSGKISFLFIGFALFLLPSLAKHTFEPAPAFIRGSSIHPGSLWYLEDRGNQATIDSFLQKSTSYHFQLNTEEKEGFGFSPNNFWIAFALPKELFRGKDKYLVLGDPSMYRADLFITQGEEILFSYQNGASIPQSKRPIQDVQLVFPIPEKTFTEQEETYLFWIRIEQGAKGIHIPLHLYNQEQLSQRQHQNALLYGILLGICLFTGLGSLAIFS